MGKKQAISVTLDGANLLWLRGQSIGRSVSDVLDQLVTDARLAGRASDRTIRSVRGTIDIPADDPDLAKADAYVRALFDQSLSRPMAVKESRATYSARRKRPPTRRNSHG